MLKITKLPPQVTEVRKSIDISYENFRMILQVAKDSNRDPKQVADILLDYALADVKVVEQESEEPQKPGRKAKKLDDGKMYALRQAGWTFDKIAEEMKVATTTVIKHLDEYVPPEKG